MKINKIIKIKNELKKLNFFLIVELRRENIGELDRY